MESTSLGLSGERQRTTAAALQQLVFETSPARAAWRRRWLTLGVHVDAFRFDPKAYLQAVFWRMRGLRVRSHSRISMLAAHSPRTYDLWVMRDEPKTLTAARAAAGSRSQIKILPVIDCRAGCVGLDDTLSSVASAGGTDLPILVGGPGVADTIRIEEPLELAGFVDSDDVWLCFLSPGDRLASGALAIYAGAAEEAPNAALIYADDDLIGPQGDRRSPHFKPDWNPDLFQHHDFITGASIVRAARETIVDGPSLDWAETLVNVALKQPTAPLHVPLVLHHRRKRPPPIVPAKPANLPSSAAPLVTVIVPTRNQAALLSKCMEGVERSNYPRLETIIVDNGSDETRALAYLAELERKGLTVLRMPGPFNFSALNNAAVALARGDLLCFLNNDVEMVDPDWLALLVRQAVRPEIGAVGARLLYPDRTVQHAGVFIGMGGAAGHGHRLQHVDDPGYFERVRLPQRVSAVTAACMVVARKKFLAVGGFDESDFPVAFNDVDLCLKLGARGWASFYEPRATLIHHESKSRGSDRAKPNRARYAAELAALQRKWHTDKRRDPYHHPRLSSSCEQFLLAI